MSKELIKAAEEGDLEKVNELLMQEDVIESMAEDDNLDLRFALLEAAKNGHRTVVERLLQVSTVSECLDGLAAAAILGDLDIINNLLETSRTLEDVASVVALAAGGGHLLIVDRLLLELQTLDETNQQLLKLPGDYVNGLIKAASNGHLEILVKLAEFCPEIFYDVWNFKDILSAAAGGGHLEIVDRLLEVPRALENIDCIKSTLLEAIWNGQLAVIDRLLELKPEVLADEDYVKNLLKETVGHGQLAVFERLLQRSQFMDELVARGNALLDSAVKEFQLEMVIRLLQIPVIKEKIVDQRNMILRRAINNVEGNNKSFRLPGAEESSAPSILYLLIRAYQSLGIELPSDITVEGGSLPEFLKDYQGKLDKVEEILLQIFPEMGILGMINEYVPIVFSELQAKLDVVKETLSGIFAEEGIVNMVDDYAVIVLGMFKNNRKPSPLQKGVLRAPSTEGPEAYPIKLVSTTSSSAGAGSTFVYGMSDGSEKIFSEAQPLGPIEAKNEQERLEQFRIFQLKTQEVSEPVKGNLQIEAIRKAFSILFSKENFMDVSSCFTEKNILAALRQEPSLESLGMYIDTLENLGQIEEADFESVLSDNGPSNHSLRGNIRRLYQEQRNLAKDLVTGNETAQEPTVTSVASTLILPTPIQELYYNLNLINSLRYKPTERDRVEQAILRIQELQGFNYFKLNETIIPGIGKILGQEVNRILAGHACLDRVVGILSQEPSIPNIESSSTSVERIEISTEEQTRMGKERWLDRVTEEAERARHQNKDQANDTQAISEPSVIDGSSIHFSYSTTPISLEASNLKRSCSEPSLITKRAVQIARRSSFS